MLMLALACATPEKTAPAAPTCAPVSDDTRSALVTDIDGTLSLSDEEFLTQMDEVGYEPEARPDADRLLQAYVALGWRVLYVTGRGERLEVADGRDARTATEDWLVEQGFPLQDEGDLFLAEGRGASDPVAYKSEVVLDRVEEGYSFGYAYGNGSTDIEAFLLGGLDPQHTFLVGEASGDAAELGVVAVPDEDAYTAHTDTWMSSVPCALEE